jgi:hypothetical protein
VACAHSPAVAVLRVPDGPWMSKGRVASGLASSAMRLLSSLVKRLGPIGSHFTL